MQEAHKEVESEAAECRGTEHSTSLLPPAEGFPELSAKDSSESEKLSLSTAPLSARSKPAASAENANHLGLTDAQKAADLKVVWGRVKGYPHWPAQVLGDDAAKSLLGKVNRSKATNMPLMFFGTFEICWLSASSIMSWQNGVKAGFLNRQKADRRLLPSIQQAQDFLQGTVHPSWWWQPNSARAAPTSCQRATERPEHQDKARLLPFPGNASDSIASIASGPAGPVPREAQPASACNQEEPSQTGILLPAPAAASAPLAAPRPPAARSRKAALPLIPGGQAVLEAPEGKHLPKYDFTRKNLWPPYLSRPKRIPRDDISACDCQVSAADDALAAAPRASVQLERSARARSVKVQEHGKLDCGPDCVNRQSFVHCDPKTCPCGSHCTNKPFHQLATPKLAVFHTGNRGWGVRALDDIPAGAFIVEYAGELLDRVAQQQRLGEQASQGISDFYMMEYAPSLFIDARLKGNLARFINSSCNPNCETQKWRDAATNEGRIGIFSKKDILAGEELAYDYNFEHSGLAEQAGAYRCRCGAVNCRGTMDTRPDRLRDAYRRIEIFWDGEQKFYRGTVVGFQAGKGTHIIKYDDGQQTRENLMVVQHRWLPDDASVCVDGQAADELPETKPPTHAPPAKRQKVTGDSNKSLESDEAGVKKPPDSDLLHQAGVAPKPELEGLDEQAPAAGLIAKNGLVLDRVAGAGLPIQELCGDSVLLSILTQAAASRNDTGIKHEAQPGSENGGQQTALPTDTASAQQAAPQAAGQATSVSCNGELGAGTVPRELRPENLPFSRSCQFRSGPAESRTSCAQHSLAGPQQQLPESAMTM